MLSMVLIVLYILCTNTITLCNTKKTFHEAQEKSLENVYKFLRQNIPSNLQQLQDKLINNASIHKTHPQGFATSPIFTGLLSRSTIYPAPTSHKYNQWRYTTLATWDIGTNFWKLIRTPKLPAIPYYTRTSRADSSIITETVVSESTTDRLKDLEAAHESWRGTSEIPTTRLYLYVPPWMAGYYRARDHDVLRQSKSSQYTHKNLQDKSTQSRYETSQGMDNTSQDTDETSKYKDKTSLDRDAASQEGNITLKGNKKTSKNNETLQDADIKSQDRDTYLENKDKLSQDSDESSKEKDETPQGRDKTSQGRDKILQDEDDSSK